MSRYVVLQEMEDEEPDVFRQSYPTLEAAMQAMREQWLDDENVRNHNAHITEQGESYMEIALGDGDDPCITLTAIEIDGDSK